MGILDIAGPIIDKLLSFIPDPAQKAAAKLAMFEAQQQGEFKEIDAQLATAKAQTDIDSTEAASTNIFESGWRPFIGWVCGIAFGYNFVLLPLFSWLSQAFFHVSVPPPLDWSEMAPVVMGMLGLGTMHTVERLNGAVPQEK